MFVQSVIHSLLQFFRKRSQHGDRPIIGYIRFVTLLIQMLYNSVLQKIRKNTGRNRHIANKRKGVIYKWAALILVKIPS
jgi:hypothetical protein